MEFPSQVVQSLWQRLGWRRGQPAIRSFSVSLECGKVWAFEKPIGGTIVCQQGPVWITQRGNPLDIILQCGQRFDYEPRGKVVVTALGKATFQVRVCSRSSAKRWSAYLALRR